MDFEVANKLDSFAARGELEIKQERFGDTVGVPCWIYYRKTGDVKTHKYYFIDLTNENVKEVVEKNMFTDFSSVQTESFSYEYWDVPDLLSKNLHLVFIFDGLMKDDYFKVEHDMEYIRKRFINKTDFMEVLDNSDIDKQQGYNAEFNYNGKSYKLSRFNYIYGNNGSGKTMMMREISNQLNLPIYEPNVFNEEAMGQLKININKTDWNRIEYYYKRMWGHSSYSNMDSSLSNCFYSDTELLTLYLATSLAQNEKQENTPILIDHILWNKHDDLRRLNIIDTLDSFINPVVISGSSGQTKGLIKVKVYGSNIIEL